MDSFKFYKTWAESIAGLPNNIRLEVYDCIVRYAFGDNVEGFGVTAKAVFSLIKPKIDEQIKQYEAICERNRRNGSKGGRPLKVQETPTEREDEKTQNNPLGFIEQSLQVTIENPLGLLNNTEIKEVTKQNEGTENPNNPVGFLGFSGFSEEKEEKRNKENTPPTPPIKEEKIKEEKEEPKKDIKKGATKKTECKSIDDFVSIEYRNIFQDWLDYKRERRETYTTIRGMRSCYTHLLNLSDRDPKKAAAIVEQSIAQNYQGLFPLKDEVFVKYDDSCVNWEKMQDRFNRLGIVKLSSLDFERKQMFLSVLEDFGKDNIITAYKNIENSNYLKGFNENQWKADFDFVFTKANFRRIIEGFYNHLK